MKLAVLAVLGALAASQAPAAVAATWSAPVTIGPSSRGVTNPSIAFAHTGGPLLSADYGSSSRLFAGSVERARVALVAPPVAFASDGAAFLRQPGHRRVAPTVALGVSIGDVTGRPGRLHLLTRREIPDSAVIAANDAGEVAVAWAEPLGRFGSRVRMAVRRPRGAFGRAVTVASGHAGMPTSGTSSGVGIAIAVGRRGEVLVAYQRERLVKRRSHRAIEARAGRPGRLGPARAIGSQQGLVDLAAAIGPSGRAVVAWGSQDVGEEANEPRNVYAAVRAAGSARFGPGQLLDRTPRYLRPEGRVVLGVARDGSALVAWSSPVVVDPMTTRSSVRAASAAPHGGFGAKAELAPDGAVSDLAIARDGTAIVVWSALADEEPRGVVAALRPAGAAAFAASEAVSPVEGSYQAAVAFDPRTNHPVVAWTGTPAGGTSEALRVAERTG